MIEQKIVELYFNDYAPYANDEITKQVNNFQNEGWVIKQMCCPGNSVQRLFVLFERNVNINDDSL